MRDSECQQVGRSVGVICIGRVCHGEIQNGRGVSQCVAAPFAGTEPLFSCMCGGGRFRMPAVFSLRHQKDLLCLALFGHDTPFGHDSSVGGNISYAGCCSSSHQRTGMNSASSRFQGAIPASISIPALSLRLASSPLHPPLLHHQGDTTFITPTSTPAAPSRRHNLSLKTFLDEFSKVSPTPHRPASPSLHQHYTAPAAASP